MTSRRKLTGGIALLLQCVALCAALLSAGGCGMSVKPSGQSVTSVSIGR